MAVGAEEDVWAALVVTGGGDDERGKADGAGEAVTSAAVYPSEHGPDLRGGGEGRRDAYRFPSDLMAELGTSKRQLGQK